MARTRKDIGEQYVWLQFCLPPSHLNEGRQDILRNISVDIAQDRGVDVRRIEGYL